MNGKGLPTHGWSGAPFLCIDLMAHPKVVAAVPVSAAVIQQLFSYKNLHRKSGLTSVKTARVHVTCDRWKGQSKSSLLGYALVALAVLSCWFDVARRSG